MTETSVHIETALTASAPATGSGRRTGCARAFLHASPRVAAAAYLALLVLAGIFAASSRRTRRTGRASTTCSAGRAPTTGWAPTPSAVTC